MGRLIDADKLIAKIEEIYDGYMLSEDGGVVPKDFVEFLEEAPTVEAIPKADYENRLATDMATIKQVSNSVKTLQKANLEIAGAYGKLETDYENRLKSDMVVMLEELKKSIKDKVYNVSAYSECLDCDVIDYEDVNEIIIEKINSLKGQQDGNE